MTTYVPKKPCKRGHFLRYTKGKICVECAKNAAKSWSAGNKARKAENMLVWQRKNREKVRQTNQNWQKTHPESVKVRQKRWQEANPSAVVKKTQRWQAKNPGYTTAQVMKRKAKKLNATPAWLTATDYLELESIYAYCGALRAVGLNYHVDHIVPLQGKRVSGLHVPWNLQVIHATENLRKHNKLLTI
jgi:hypothetical protein